MALERSNFTTLDCASAPNKSALACSGAMGATIAVAGVKIASLVLAIATVKAWKTKPKPQLWLGLWFG